MTTTFELTDFLKAPDAYIKKVPVEEIIKFLEVANEFYRNNNETLINDDLYDMLNDFVKKKDPSNPFFKKVGAEAPENKELLPEWMGSLDKVRDDPKALTSWMSKYEKPYIISEKLDGNSGMFAIKKNKTMGLFTRGDGTYGRNISSYIKYFIKDIKDISSIMATSPVNPKKDYPLLVRGELILSKKAWEIIKDAGGANARNVIAGCLNAKHPDEEIAKHIEFVAYELVEPKMQFYDGLKFLESLGFNVVYHHQIEPEEVNSISLSQYLLQRRKISQYEIDGIVIRDNLIHKIIKGKNPKYAFAFKTMLTHEEAEVVVLKVSWNVSKDGLIKPIVEFSPVTINNVKIKQATGFNGAFIENNVIGMGSRITIIRSGDVIPHIINVITPSTTGKASMPDIPYEWTDTRVDIKIKEGDENDQHKLQQMVHFASKMDIKDVGEGVLNKMFKKGIDTIPKLLAVEKADLLLLDGIKETSADKIYKSIQKAFANTNCLQLMVASNLFGKGFGERKLKSIVEAHPEILEKALLTSLRQVDGIGSKTEEQFLEHLPNFYKFLDEIGYSCVPQNKEKPKENSKQEKVFDKMTIVFTGFRNKDFEKLIEELGGKVGTSINKSTSMVITNDKDDNSTKIQKARDLGITIYDKESFIKKYHKYGF